MQHANSYRRNLQISEIYHFVVLGYPTIGTGEQYLEVDMCRSDAWLLGLYHGPHAVPQLCSMNEMFPNVKFYDDDIQIIFLQKYLFVCLFVYSIWGW